LSFTQWQIGNLNEYSAIPTGDNRIGNNFTFNVKTSGQFTNYTVAPSSVGVVSTSTEGHGHGFNTNMLPGSYTAADRFVKMFFLKQLAAHHSSPLLLEEGIILATGLINTVHIL
jgi:penicillin V acylase-like amidase (Ntn superfamily)